MVFQHTAIFEVDGTVHLRGHLGPDYGAQGLPDDASPGNKLVGAGQVVTHGASYLRVFMRS